ncbi:hypothetical protein ACIA5C_33655 [Actinoplanes sp. NPDC051343]
MHEEAVLRHQFAVAQAAGTHGVALFQTERAPPLMVAAECVTLR